MNTSFKQFKSKFMKMSLAMTVVVSTCSLAYGTVVNSGDIVVESVPSADGDNSIIQDNVNPEKVVEKIKAKSVFNKKENIIRLEWDSSKKENKYKVYRLAAEEDLNKNNKEDIREINKKKFILLKEIQECELEIENTYKPNAPKINIPKEYTDEIEITIENEELPLIHSYYIESIDEDGDVVEKTEEIKVGLENTIKGYSYVINSKEDDEPNEKVDTKKNTIKIKLGYEKKYLHIRAIDINGVAGESVTIELPEAVSREDNSQITKIVRTNQINHNIKPSDWTNKDVDINIHAISKKGFKQIVYPDGIIEDLTTSGLHLYGGEGRDDFKNVAPTKDGGFIAVGESNSSTFNGEKLSLAGGMDAIIVKYDEGGNVEWVKTWGRTGADAFHGVTEVVKNNKVVGYVAVGESNTENTYNSVVVRFDVNGNKVWEDIIPGVAVNEVLWDVIQDSAGRIVTAGWHTSNVKDDRDGIIRIYELDSPQAIKVVTSPYDIPSENKWFSEGYDAIKEVPDGYVVVGSSREWNVSSRIYEPRVGRIVKFDKELNVVWNKSFKGAYNLDKEMDFDNVVLTSDGNVVVVGDGSVDKGEDVLEEAKGDRDGFIIKFNIKDGSVIWSKRFGGSGEEQMYGIQERSNGDLVVIGETSSSDKDFSGTIKDPNEMELDDVFVMTFAGDTGEKVGAVTRIGGKGNDIGWAIRTLNDGRLVSVGTTTSGQSQGNDAFVCFIKGTTDINTKYTVSGNGTYKFKFTDVSNAVHDYSATVSNIDKEPPQIVLSDKTEDGEYKINAKVTDNVGIAVQKWATGEQSVDYFSENGDVFTGNVIEVDSKNTYTVYARDLAGNENREIIKLQDGELPSINLSAKANHHENYIDLNWTTNTDSYIYKAYGRKLGDKEFQPVSEVDFDDSEKLTDKTHVEDRNAMDLDEPTKPTVKSDVVRKFSLIRGFEQNISLELSSTDKGTTYEHYVEGLHKSDYSNKIVSNTTVTTITSGVKGYSYVIDKNKTTEPDGAIDTTGKVIDVEINPGDVKYVHVKAIDYAGNESETLHFEVKLPGLMTDYILSNANIKDGKGVKVNKLLRKGEYKYSFDVSNLAGTAFVSTFGGSKDEHIYKTILDEGSYISVGNTYSNDYTFNGMGRGNSDAFIVKYDNKGELIWKKVFGGSKDDYFTSIKKVDGGYIVTGHSASLDGSMADVKNAGDRDAVIIKYDYEGNIIWKTVVGGTASDDVHDVVQTKDGGYLIVGGYGKIHNANGLGYILKLDKNGKVEFEKKYGGSGTDEFQNIISNEDGTYTIIGYTSSPNAFGASKGGQDGVLLHIDEKGNIIKQKRYGGSGEDLFRTISRSSDGELYIGGYTHSKDGDLLNIKTTTTRDGLVIKLDKNWNVHWVKSWGGTNGAEYFLASYATGDGIVMSGFGTSTDGALSGNNGAEDAMIVKFNENGNCEWERNFGGSGSERLRTIVETPEGGYLIGGDSSSNDGLLSGKNKGNADALLVKFNPDGSLGLMPNDDEISEISYKIETDKSGVRRVIKQGEFTSVIVKPSQTIKKEISFNVPNEEIDKLVFTAMLVDKQDSNMSNNKVVIEVPIYKGKDTDFSLSNDKVVDVNGGTPTELEIAKEYTYKFDVSNWDTTPFIKTFGGTGNEHFEKHIITSDGGIVAVGRTGSSDKDLKGMNKGNNDALIVKYDQHGNVEWKDSYGGKESDMFYQAMELSDGSIVAVGQKSGKDNLIVKYTKDGKFIWERVYRDSQVSSTRVTNAIVDENDNMYLVDTGYSGSTYLSDPAYSKWDKNGNRIWRKFLNQYGESGTTTIYGIDLANNGDLFLTGKYAASNGSFAGLPNRGGTEGFVAKVSSNNGAIRWMTGISGSDHDDTRQVAEDEDGNVIVIGRTVSGDGDFNGLKKPLKNGNYASGSLASDAYYKRQDGFMAKLSSTGRLQKIKVIGGGAYDNLRYLSKMKDGKFLVAGDTASTDGDFANRRVMDKGYTDTVWMKINKDLNIEWVSILGGDNDDATQSSIELPDGSIVVAGETKSTTGDFAGLNKGGQDAFIARLNEEGKLDVLPYDEMIGSIDYDVSWSDGKNLYPIKSGSFYNEEVPVGVTKQKSIKFTVPRESKIKSVVVSAEIVDRNDLNPANNRVEKSINVIKPYDYTIKAYNVKETNKSELIGTLRKGRSYDLNIKLRNQLMGIDEDSRAFSISDLFGGNVAKASQGNIESFKYKILTTDGLNPQNVNDITFDNVKGTVLAKGERKNLAIEEGGDRWEKITFKTLDDDDMAEVIFVAQIEALDDADLTNNKLVVKLPIVNHEDPEISIKSIEVYPDSATGDNKLLIGNETNVKVKLTSNELRSNNVNVKLTVEQNGKKSVLEKYAYGVSKENPGVVYFKYKPQDIGQVKVVAEIDTLGKKKQSDPVYATVGRSEDVSNYKHAPVKDSDKYNISSSVVTYVKSNKRDKDVVKVRYCASAKDCQEDFNGRVKCPGHEYFDWGDWYEAYVPIKSTELTGFEEWYEIKKVMFRSKQTEMYKNSSNNNVDQDGYVDLLDEEGSKLAIVKAGYGFDMKVETEYKNNAPSLFEKAYTQNRVPQDTRWSKYNVIPHGEARIPFIYYASNGKSIDDEIQSVRGVVSFTVPSLNDVIFENPDQLYMEMPDGKFAIVDEGYGENYGDKVDTILRITNNSKTKIIGNVYSDIKEFELKSNTQEGSEKRQYYVDSGIKDGDYGIKIFNRYSGYGPSSRNKLHLSKDVKIKVKGTRYEDLIDRPFKR